MSLIALEYGHTHGASDAFLRGWYESKQSVEILGLKGRPPNNFAIRCAVCHIRPQMLDQHLGSWTGHPNAWQTVHKQNVRVLTSSSSCFLHRGGYSKVPCVHLERRGAVLRNILSDISFHKLSLASQCNSLEVNAWPSLQPYIWQLHLP